MVLGWKSVFKRNLTTKPNLIKVWCAVETVTMVCPGDCLATGYKDKGPVCILWMQGRCFVKHHIKMRQWNSDWRATIIAHSQAACYQNSQCGSHCLSLPIVGALGRAKNTLKIKFKRAKYKLGIITQINQNITLQACDLPLCLRLTISGRGEAKPRIRKSLCSKEKHSSTKHPGTPALVRYWSK